MARFKEYELEGLRYNLGIIFQDYIRYQMTFYQIAVGNIKELDNEALVKEQQRKV
jgi:ATP-binding cassette subfamily B protein